jgi:hypothetical protein
MRIHIDDKTMCVYYPQPAVANRQCAPDVPISPVKMGPGKVPIVRQFKHPGSLIVAPDSDDCDGEKIKN